MTARLGAMLLSGVLLVSACAASAPTSSPAASGVPPATGQQSAGATESLPTPTTAPQPSIGGQPGLEDLPELTPEDLNPPDEPLPEPLLATADQVTEAIYAFGAEDQIVVSMLNLLGIGIYREDGSVIRAGTEQSDADFYMFEPEVYGLIAMLGDQADGETWLDFRDFHSAMVEFGLEASPEELLAAYADAYAESPEAPMTQFVQAQAFLDIEAQIPPLGVWLLFLDGMIPPHASNAVTAAVGGTGPAFATGPRSGGIGISFARVQQLLSSPDVQRARISAQLSAAMAVASLRVDPQPPSVHEGHGGPGSPSTLTATVLAYDPTSPRTGQPLGICPGATVGGLAVTWQYGSKLTAHGSATVTSGGTSPTDTRGDARLVYTPRPEVMPDPSRGYVLRDVATVTAAVSKADLIRSLCPNAPPGTARLVRGRAGSVSASVQMEIKWHEPRAMRVTLDYLYGVEIVNQVAGNARTSGVDNFDGVLVEQPDGIWTGAVFARARGSANGVFLGSDATCKPNWTATQVLEVFAERRAGVLPGHDPETNSLNGFVLEFYPLTPPRVALGSSLCPALRRPSSRFDYAPFGDARVFDTDVGLVLEFPATTITTTTYDIPSSTNVIMNNTRWEVRLELLVPPP